MYDVWLLSSTAGSSALSYLAASLLNYHQIEIESDFVGTAAGGTLLVFLKSGFTANLSACLPASLPLCPLLHSEDLLSQLSGQRG